jgi:hypothetical protein
MCGDQLFRDLRKRLLARGMAVSAVHRYLVELRDHRNDLMEEGVASGLSREEAMACAEKRLGGVEQLAKAAIRCYRKGTFLGRHPIFFFGFAPVLAVYLTIIAFPIIWLFFWRPWLYSNTYPLSPGAISSMNAVSWTLCIFYDYIIPSVLALLFYRAARRRALASLWCIFPCLIFTFVAAWLKIFIHFQHDAPHGVLGYGMLDRPSFSMGILPLVTILLWDKFATLRRRRLAHM